MPQLKTSMLVQSALAMANSQMVAMVLVRRGDADNGAVMVRLDLPDGTSVIERRVLNFDGGYEWANMTDAPISAEDAEKYCQREIDIDPDCWIVAIDSVIGNNPLRDITF